MEGSVIGVVVVIIILGLMAGVVGRMCSGRSVMGRGNYDFEAWVETKCSTCIDGRVDPPQPRPRHPLNPPPPPSMPQTTAEAEVEGEMESDAESSDESLHEPEHHPSPPIQLPEHHHQRQQQQQIHQKHHHEDRPESSKSRQQPM